MPKRMDTYMSEKTTDIKEMDESALASGADTPALNDDSEKLVSDIKESISAPLAGTLLKLLLGILVIAALVMFVTGMIKYGQLSQESKRLEQEAEAYRAEIEEIEYLIDSPVDYEYIIRIARERLGMYLPDERVYHNDINE